VTLTSVEREEFLRLHKEVLLPFVKGPLAAFEQGSIMLRELDQESRARIGALDSSPTGDLVIGSLLSRVLQAAVDAPHSPSRDDVLLRYLRMIETRSGGVFDTRLRVLEVLSSHHPEQVARLAQRLQTDFAGFKRSQEAEMKRLRDMAARSVDDGPTMDDVEHMERWYRKHFSPDFAARLEQLATL